MDSQASAAMSAERRRARRKRRRHIHEATNRDQSMKDNSRRPHSKLPWSIALALASENDDVIDNLDELDDVDANSIIGHYQVSGRNKNDSASDAGSERQTTREFDRNQAYRDHLELVLRTVFIEREDYKRLSTEEERTMISQLLESASQDAKSLLARIFPRRGPWFRAEHLAKYFLPRRIRTMQTTSGEAEINGKAEEVEQNAEMDLNAQDAVDAAKRAQAALLELCQLGFARRFDASKANLEESLSMAEAVLTAGELQMVLKLAKLERKGGGRGVSAKTKAEAISCLRMAGKSQRTVFGQTLPITKFIRRVTEDEMIALQTVPQALVQRAFSLYYLTASASSFQKVQDGTSTRYQGETTTFHFPGLLSMFGKQKFAKYKCNVAWPIFHNRRSLENYEAAIALQAWLEAFSYCAQAPDAKQSAKPLQELEKSEPRKTSASLKREATRQQVLSTPTQGTAVEVIDLVDGDSDCANDDNGHDQENSSHVFDIENAPGVALKGAVEIDAKGTIGGNQPLPSNEKPLISFSQLTAKGLQELELEKQSMDNLVDLLFNLLREACCEDANTADAKQAPIFLEQFRASYALCEAIAFGITCLEKEHKYDLAVHRWQELLQAHSTHRHRGSWWNRLSIDQKHLGDLGGSIQTLVGCLLDPAVDEHSAYRVEAQKRLAKLLRNPKLEAEYPQARAVLFAHSNDVLYADLPEETIFGRRRTFGKTSGAGERCEFFSSSDTPTMFCYVEEFVLEHFEESGGWLGLHCEGQIFRNLFALFMWDIIFDDQVVNVFQTPFQQGPLDLFHCSGSFFEARRDRISESLEQIRAMNSVALAKEVHEAWESQHGTQVCGMRWDACPEDTLACIAACIGGGVLAAIFERLCKDYNHWAGGGPDLLLYRVACPGTGPVYPCDVLSKPLQEERENLGSRRGRAMRYVEPFPLCEEFRYEARFLEVKSENDRLSHKQLSWLLYLRQAGADAKVCNVNDVDPTPDAISSSGMRGKNKRKSAKKTT